MYELERVISWGAGAVMAFFLFRGFIMWRKWSDHEKENDEIKMDKKISDAIKSGDTELIAKIRKYFLSYKRENKKGRVERPDQSVEQSEESN